MARRPLHQRFDGVVLFIGIAIILLGLMLPFPFIRLVQPQSGPTMGGTLVEIHLESLLSSDTSAEDLACSFGQFTVCIACAVRK